MLNQPTSDKLTRLKLFSMALAFTEKSALDLDHEGFVERLGLRWCSRPAECPQRLFRASAAAARRAQRRTRRRALHDAAQALGHHRCARHR